MNFFFQDRDLQCDFNSPFWEETTCAWSYAPSSGLVTYPWKRMEWVKNIDLSAENYWIGKDPRTDNYHLAGFEAGDYLLLSKWQVENGPRMFDSHFGFAYKARNTNVKVSLYLDDGSNPTVILDKFVDAIQKSVVDEGWHYFSKNLTDFQRAHSTSEFKWRVGIFTNTLQKQLSEYFFFL